MGSKFKIHVSRIKEKAVFDTEGDSVTAAISHMPYGQQRRLRDPTQLSNEKGHVIHNNPIRSHRSYLERLFC